MTDNATADTTHAFMVALVEAVMKNDAKTVEGILRGRADIDADLLAPSMVKASVNGYTEMTRLLIAHGANVNHQNSIKSTPLIVAAYWGSTEVARLLIDSGAELDLTECTGNSALMDAAKAGRVETARLLIDRGADINMQNLKGDTAESLALEKGHREILRLLEEARGRHHAAALKNQRQLNGRAFKPKIIRGLQP